MALKRTTVHVEAEDLAVIKEAAAREGISAAEIIREGVHLAAMSRRVWDEPFFSSTYRPLDTAAAETLLGDRAAAYELTEQSAAARASDSE